MSISNERSCRSCPAFFEVKEEGLVPTAGGWSNHKIDGKDVVCCRPGHTIQQKKPMQIYGYYCLATKHTKKIGHKASWTGRTPVWCPLGRTLDEEGK